jgi:purine-binding chemotaxis protein CheW
MAEQTRFLTLRSAGQLYALPAGEVSEIIRLATVARVPHAPKGLLGLTNLRGDVLPVASLRGLLGEEAAPGEAARAVVLEGAAPMALAVDSVETLMAINEDKVETRQSELATRQGERLRGAFTAPNGDVVRILDIATLIGAAFTQVARKRPRRAEAIREEARAPGDKSAVRELLVSFEVAGQEYALPLAIVQEVLEAPAVWTTVPSKEQLVMGVTPFRETLLPLLSLRGLLGLDARQPERRQKVVVARVAGSLVGLVADRMRAVVAADPAELEKVPPVLSARAGGEARISGIYRGGGGRRLVSLLSPEQLFREDVMQRLKGGARVEPASDENTAPSRGGERRYVVFRLGEDEFGLPIETVSEVARVPDQITRLPRTPKFLEGVVNLRGDVLPVVDQRRRFDMPPLAGAAARRLVVVTTERHKAGLIVDSVSEVLQVSADDIAPAPTLTNEAVRLVQGVVNVEKDSRIILLLDPAELLTRAERGLLDAFEARTERARA